MVMVSAMVTVMDYGEHFHGQGSHKFNHYMAVVELF